MYVLASANYSKKVKSFFLIFTDSYFISHYIQLQHPRVQYTLTYKIYDIHLPQILLSRHYLICQEIIRGILAK